MINKRTLKLYREFKALKKKRHLLTKQQYVNELENLMVDFNADIDAPELSNMEMSKLFKLISSRVRS
ncbi:hypothetical protein [Flagellimonas sp.]|uniref:hypothetical protein n=1 Tax=Flagellimonas sp. TaxID=2058762 RepID=UPI003BA998AF